MNLLSYSCLEESVIKTVIERGKYTVLGWREYDQVLYTFKKQKTAGLLMSQLLFPRIRHSVRISVITTDQEIAQRLGKQTCFVDDLWHKLLAYANMRTSKEIIRSFRYRINQADKQRIQSCETCVRRNQVMSRSTGNLIEGYPDVTIHAASCNSIQTATFDGKI